MGGLWVNDPETVEGKYPIVLRRDGSVLTSRYLVMVLRDPCAAAAFRAYADEAERRGLDPHYIADVRQLAIEAEREATLAPGDPDAPKHRKDDPIIIGWARSVHGTDSTGSGNRGGSR